MKATDISSCKLEKKYEVVNCDCFSQNPAGEYCFYQNIVINMVLLSLFSIIVSPLT